MIEIRYIPPKDDSMVISKIYEESWKYAYKGLIPQDYLQSIPAGYWITHINSPNRKILICIDDGKLVGTSSFCESQYECFKGWGEVISIYFLPNHIGKGYGKKLLKSVMLELEKLGYKNVFLWVLEENMNARRFYEKFGLSPTTDYLTDRIGGKEVKEIRYIYKVKES